MSSERGVVQVPHALRVTAREHGLGARKGLVRNEPKRFPWGAVLPVGVLGVFLGWLAVSYAIEDQREQGAWYFSLPLLVLAAIPLGFVGFFLSAWLFRPRPPQIWVAWYEHGVLRHTDRGETEPYTWDEIAAVTRQDIRVTNGITGAGTHRLTIEAEHGAEIVVGDEFDGIVPFAEGLCDAFSRARVPRDAARLEAGERIGFGVVGIDLSGITQGGRRIPWQEVERVDVRQGVVEIRRRGDRTPWTTLPAPGFPNLAVFLTLADALLRHHEA
ncbi:DUF6585 family protein [Streptomyces sp. NPDC056460]|uniref:DUF6585 family protein n=1 Tax=Streptomyces sp. NPDC056460 TaxID=3345825 RepID=UPI0036CC4D21